MFRLRRYRALLLCAFVITVLLYHVSKNSSQWDHSRDIWHPTHTEPRPQPPPPPAPKPVNDDTRRPQIHDQGDPPKPNAEPAVKIPQLKTSDGAKGGYGLPTRPATVPDRKLPSSHDDYPRQNEGAGLRVADPFRGPHGGDPVPTTTIHWQKPKEWFPVPEESLMLLPTGKPKPIPRVQFSFGAESFADKEKREQRQAKVKAEAERAWAGYRKYAWTHDELTPVTKGAKNPFCGWAATLVDSLDTLWIMGMKEEFDEAVEAVKDIDFTTTPYREDIPVFETIIRYLGGLIGAYDVTGNDPRYRSLLDKAVELAEILMSVFDTPNRMPILYYNWKPAFNENPKRASTGAGVAELGSMSLEFTRLAQLTGRQKYYDAIARITDAFEDLQNRPGGTAIPGIFPENLDASGCNRTAPRPSSLENSSEAVQNQANSGAWRRASDGGPAADGVQANTGSGSGAVAEVQPGLRKRNGPSGNAPQPLNSQGLPANWDCVPQNLTGAGYGGGGAGSYSMGGSQDSAYEYFPKQYLMLGGLEPKYRTMHLKTVEAVKEYLLFRPMAEGDPDILFAAKAYSSDGTDNNLSYQWEVQHLTCFIGGMFGLGGKIFDRPEDVEIGKKLTDGCVWAYEVMPTGIMPEYSTVMPCKDPNDCHYDQSLWYRVLDPNAELRDRQVEEYHERLENWKEQVKKLQEDHMLQKQAADQQRQAQDDQGTRNLQDSLDVNSPGGSGQKPMGELVIPPAPIKPETHLEYVTNRVRTEHIPPGFVTLNDKRYILRPEAIESVWYMYRITGDPIWQEKGWRMFEAVIRATSTEVGHSAIRDVTSTENTISSSDLEDSMESFWLAETLKYFYLLFSTPDVISLDEWVLNTEAHAFRRPT